MCYKVGSHAVASVPLTVPCVFGKCEVGERFESKIGGGVNAVPVRPMALQPLGTWHECNRVARIYDCESRLLE